MFYQIERAISETIGHIFQVIFRPTAKSKLSEELERYLQNSSTDALIKIDPDGLSSEDIKQLKELIKTAKTERPK